MIKVIIIIMLIIKKEKTQNVKPSAFKVQSFHLSQSMFNVDVN